MLPDPRDPSLLWFSFQIQAEVMFWHARNVSKRCVSLEEFDRDFQLLKKELGLRERPAYAM